jgi:hypothetical protein
MISTALIGYHGPERWLWLGAYMGPAPAPPSPSTAQPNLRCYGRREWNWRNLLETQTLELLQSIKSGVLRLSLSAFWTATGLQWSIWRIGQLYILVFASCWLHRKYPGPTMGKFRDMGLCNTRGNLDSSPEPGVGWGLGNSFLEVKFLKICEKVKACRESGSNKVSGFV